MKKFILNLSLWLVSLLFVLSCQLSSKENKTIEKEELFPGQIFETKRTNVPTFI